MAASQPGYFNVQEFTDAGILLVGGRLYTYAYGTTTQKTAYTDAAGLVPHTYTSDGIGGQYIAMNARGELPAPLYLSTGSYDISLKRSDGSTVWTRRADGVDNLVNSGFANLATSAGASLVGFLQAGAGAIVSTVQAKLRSILIDRNDFSTTPQFTAAAAAAPTTPTLDGSGNFGAKITPTGELSQIDLAAGVRPTGSANRSAIRYRSSVSVYAHASQNVVMGGFRFLGQYLKGRGPIFTRASSGISTISMTTDLGAETVVHLNGWYAVFEVANAGDAAPVFKLMPALRVGSIAGSVVTLNSAAEGVHSVIATTYAFSVNGLANVDCLVISETIDARANTFSGRVTTITANTTSTVTLATAGGVAVSDWLLPAPPGYTFYNYAGMFYYESPGDVRNIGDSTTTVRAKMTNSSDPNFSATGAIASPVAIRFGGYVSPLATAVIVKETLSIAGTAVGEYASYFATDTSGHTVHTCYGSKEATTNMTMVFDNVTIPFAFGQSIAYSNAGALTTSRTGGTLEITGWIEP